MAAPPSDRIHPVVAGVSVAVLCLVWGSTWLAIQFGLRDLPTVTGAAARFAIAAVVMSFVVVPLLGAREGGERPPLWLSASVGVLQFFASYSIVYWSETVLPSSMVAVLWATFPLMMAGAGHFVLGEHLRPVQVLGFALGFAGVVTLQADLLEAGSFTAGLILLGSPLVTVVGTVILKRYGAGYSSLRVNRDAMAIGAVLLTLTALVFEHDRTVAWTPTAVGSVLYLSLFGTCLTFSLYFWLMRRISASKLSLIAFANPCVALLLGGLVGEPITPWTLAGSALVLLSVALVVVRFRRPRYERLAAGTGEPTAE